MKGRIKVVFFLQDFPHKRLERCDKIQNPVKERNGEDLDVKEIDWKCNRSNEVYPKRAARQDAVNVGELEG